MSNPLPADSATAAEQRQLTAGRPWPLGAQRDAKGVNFAVFSAHAQAIELCLFDSSGGTQIERMPLPARSGDIWHGYLEGAEPGLVYGLRASGPWRPENGHWFNPAKLLLDPYARDIVGRFEWRAEHFAGQADHPERLDQHDNAAFALKARVLDPDLFDWEGDQPPGIAPADTVIYELQVKAFSIRNPAIPAELRGSYAAVAHPASIAHFKRLGITTLELLPVHYHLDEQRLDSLRLTNHWGYNSLGFFCLDPKFSAGIDGLTPRDEFRTMVKALHRAGIEVILDVVYNHTAESDAAGPSLSFRGIDNASYYRHHSDSNHRCHLENFSGCGNTLDVRQPGVLQLVMDSLRYWAGDMHVDGFRFDLAPVLGRSGSGFDNHAEFFAALSQDPLLSHVKLIAEPWDTGPGGYQVGNFPRGWLEWNDHFRDTMRGFWLHMGLQGGPTRAEFALRLCGSSDLFENRSRRPAESINYVVSHDGFSLQDLVSYRDRHNHANGENNQDGHRQNLSFNCGVEGASNEFEVKALRSRLQRVLLATALLAQGTPMLAAGDELGHGQNGNNNPYCQDNEITWIDWDTSDQDLIEFTARVLALRKRLLPLANAWYSGIRDRTGAAGLAWLRADGQPLEGDAWRNPDSRLLGCLIRQPGRADHPLVLLVNGDCEDRGFELPAGRWRVEFDSVDRIGGAHDQATEGQLSLPAHSLLLLVPDTRHH